VPATGCGLDDEFFVGIGSGVAAGDGGFAVSAGAARGIGGSGAGVEGVGIGAHSASDSAGADAIEGTWNHGGTGRGVAAGDADVAERIP